MTDMELDMVADKVVDKVADMVAGHRHTICYSVHNSAVSEVVRC